MPKVSVIMPAYNAASYLEESVNSLLSQSYKDWELLIIDDCSKDHTLDVAKNIAKKDKRIRVIPKEKNSGSADTRNQGIELASGEYIAFLDADDLWESNFLDKMIPFMEENKSSFSFSSYRIIDENGFEFCEPFLVEQKSFSYRNLLHYNRVGLLTAIYHIPTVGKKYFDPSLKSLRDDYALWLDILRDGRVAFANSEILARYRVRRGAATSNKKKVMIAHFKMLRNRENLNIFYALLLTIIHGLLGLRKYRIKS
ncbi:Glycosyltransferase [Leptospira biflexa serovar Patoc strain 'Patoc 1 (Ames)']|jgi:glycosyltransferase involved in cell wall biosynthesis|uniref:Putative glycosyltransferase n=1 Tax=Leptospira biflexa serovar Patoc (strain Patoc 1 / ATCC 23582 / Paris) TaxID=456481 RepID=B0SSK9_LEPBP|nr:glycosyltransferase family 2 protein [Leptospira biflexa]ABZ94447.1 Glycosyltransferase [Leptospira biflexa serovar Patoc strain 'Patoc 1 (Ames)']ABZ98099.1 Putative glycosyltransferase [Leptospira biflexa serovar Patoc strain 'Patoc 1 (Paris)']